MADIAKPREERLLVCVSPSSTSAQLINSTKTMATGLHAKWFAVYVEQPKMAMLPEAARSRAADNLRLADDLGGEAVTLTGRNIAEEIANFARERNVTRILVGKPRHAQGRGPSRETPWINWCESAERPMCT
jgi:two-component system, OmpR family, sensor histidine kinase KdpD